MNTNVTTTTTTTTANENEYYNGVLYARAFINEIKIIEPSKGDNYCAVNATLLSQDEGVNLYQTIDLIVRGESTKEIIKGFWDARPKNRFEKDGDRWIADINVGSIDHCCFPKKNGEHGAVLKGRLINIRSLKIGGDVVFGDMKEMQNPTFVGPAVVNLIDTEKGFAKASLLDGKKESVNYQNISLSFDGIEAFNNLNERNLCPQGYEHRDTNPSVFSVLELSKLEAKTYEDKESGKCSSYLAGELAKVRYLKVEDELFVA